VHDHRLPAFPHLQAYGKMARFASAVEIARFMAAHWQARKRCNTVIGLLAVPLHMSETHCGKRLMGKTRIVAFGLLETQHIRLMLSDETSDQIEPFSNGIDVPSGN